MTGLILFIGTGAAALALFGAGFCTGALAATLFFEDGED